MTCAVVSRHVIIVKIVAPAHVCHLRLRQKRKEIESLPHYLCNLDGRNQGFTMFISDFLLLSPCPRE